MPESVHLDDLKAMGDAWRRFGSTADLVPHLQSLPTVVACGASGPLVVADCGPHGWVVFDDDRMPPASAPLPDAPGSARPTAGPAPGVLAKIEQIKALAHDESLPPEERFKRVKAMTQALASQGATTLGAGRRGAGRLASGAPTQAAIGGGGGGTASKKRCSVPDSDDGVLVSSGNEPWLTHLQDRLEESGYRVTTLVGAGVQTYRAVPSGGVLLINAHSAPAWSLFNRGREFAIWTADQVNLDLERRWAREIADGDIIKYFRGDPLDFAHYAITDAFVAKHFPAMPANSLVVLESCHGGAASAAPLRKALHAKGADVVAGWSWKVPDQLGGGTQWFLFDRLTGGGDAVDVDLTGYGGTWLHVPSEREATGFEQRAFDWPHVETDMLSKGLGIFHSPDLSYLTRLIFEPGAGSLGPLRPSIATMTVDESTSLLTITGLFGKGPYTGARRVTVDGIEVGWSRWDDDEIECGPLPRSGAGSCGDVVVHIGRRTSNAAPLTSWTSTFTLSCRQPGKKRPFAVLTGPITLRGDVHASRELPGRRPGSRTMVAQLVLDDAAPAAFTLGGTHQAGQFSYAWSFEGNVKPGASPDGSIVAWLKSVGADVTRPGLRLEASGFAAPLGSLVLKDLAAGKRYDLQAAFRSVEITGKEADLLKGSVTWSPGAYGVPGGKREGTMSWGVEPPVDFPATFEWTDFVVTHEPTADTPA